QKLSIFVAEGIQFITLGIEHTQNVAMLVAHWHNDLGTSRVKRGQIARIAMHVAHDDRVARLQRSAAYPLRDGKPRVGRRLAAGFGKDHKFIFDNLVNSEPAIIARGANHLHELPHAFSGAATRERERANLLKLFARCLLHSREGNLVQKKNGPTTTFRVFVNFRQSDTSGGSSM